VFIKIKGQQHYLWRAVDQDGEVVDVYLQDRRDGAAAKRFRKRVVKRIMYTKLVSANKSRRVLKRPFCFRQELTKYGKGVWHVLPFFVGHTAAGGLYTVSQTS
jgi:hypothetical protein